MAPMWKKLMKHVDIDEQTSFLDHENLECTQHERPPYENIIEEYKEKFESRILLEQLKNYQGGKSLTQKLLRGPATWKDLRKNALRDIANEHTEQLVIQSFKSLFGRSPHQEGGT